MGNKRSKELKIIGSANLFKGIKRFGLILFSSLFLFLLLFFSPNRIIPSHNQLITKAEPTTIGSIDEAADENYAANIDGAIVPLSSATSLAHKDTSGTFKPNARKKEKEMISERTETFKKFDQGNNTYRVGGQIGAIHYKLDPFDENETYKEIDLTIKKTPDASWDYEMDNNGYQTRFWNMRRMSGEILLIRTSRYGLLTISSVRGLFTMEFDHYAEVPGNITEEIKEGKRK